MLDTEMSFNEKDKNVNNKNIHYIYDMLNKFAGDKNNINPNTSPTIIKKENI
jgi:hypothetical protein